ncbi:MAG: hypothetical protein JWM19_7668 [Actinomycetia bacterium]|nr:hypothetical protein [Actinomycetes bacterium]
MAPGQLSRRLLNRTLLRRQLLDAPSPLPVPDAVRQVAGLQAQIPRDPYIGLWSRLAGFSRDDLATAISGRQLVRVALMRSTIHLVTAADCRGFRPAVQPALDRELFTTATWSRPIAGLDLAAILAEARDVLKEQPMTAQELGRRLRERWPDRDGRAMAYAVRNLETLVQVPPRGLWGQPGQPRHATARDWLGADPDGEPPGDPRVAVEALVVRYLAAFGPAAVRDIQAWAGVTRLGEVVSSLRPRLRAYRGADGRELWDLADAELANEDAPVPVRFLPEYDNAILGYADRSRILPDGVTFSCYAARLRPKSVVRGGVLVDGFLRGTWAVSRQGSGEYALQADPFEGESWPGDEVAGRGAELTAFISAA